LRIDAHRPEADRTDQPAICGLCDAREFRNRWQAQPVAIGDLTATIGAEATVKQTLDVGAVERTLVAIEIGHGRVAELGWPGGLAGWRDRTGGGSLAGGKCAAAAASSSKGQRR
jgi:hypothetical protein